MGAGLCVLQPPRRREEVQVVVVVEDKVKEPPSWNTPGLVNIITGVMATDKQSTGLVTDNILHLDIKKT